MITLIDPVFWVDKIKNECPIFQGRAFETVENDNHVLDFFDSPMALVYLSGDSSEPGELTNRVYQKHSYTLVVKIAIRKTTGKNDRLITADSRLIRACRMEVLNALLGWTPPDCQAPVEHVGGELSIKDQLLFWPDRFTAFDYLEAAGGYSG